MQKRANLATVLIVIVVISLVASGCGGQEVEATPTPTKTATPLPPAATDTPTAPTATSTPANTPTPIAAAPPTDTPVPTPEGTPTPTSTPEPVAFGRPTEDDVNTRKGPGTNYGKVGQVYTSDNLGLIGKSQDGRWYKVCCVEGQEAWISGQFLNVSGDLAALPVVEAPALTAETQADASAATNRGTGGSGGSGPGFVAIGQVEPAVDTPPPGKYFGLCGLKVRRPKREVAPSRPALTGNINPLTGQAVDPSLLQHRILAVRMGNEPAILGYYGLSDADLVFEELMDSMNTTRFTAFYLAGDAPQVGPLRSYRSTTIQLAQMYDAVLASSGAVGPNQVFAYAAGLEDIDWRCNDAAYYLNPNADKKDYQNRVVSNIARLRAYMQSKGIDKPATVRSFAFSDAPPAGRPATRAVVPYVNRGFYEVEWRYDPGSGLYQRFQGTGRKPFVDANNGRQVSASNVVIMTVKHDITDLVEDVVNSKSIRTYIVGQQGPATVVRDGVAVDGFWRVTEKFNGLELVDAAGNPIPLKPGQTWFQIVPPNYTVTVAG